MLTRHTVVDESYSGGPGFESQLRDQLPLRGVLVVFLSHSRQMLGRDIKIGHDLFLPHSVQFIMSQSSNHSTLLTL